MNRITIKQNAKSMIKGNLWTLWKPILIVQVIASLIAMVALLFFPGEADEISTTAALLTTFLGILLMPVQIGLFNYLLKFVRNQGPTVNDLWKHFSKFSYILLTSILTVVLILLGFIALIIPGIILSFGLGMVNYIMADDDYTLRPVETLKESWHLMKGYKFDYFVFALSFIGWSFLIPFTFGLLMIWLLPYMAVANALYFENLKKLKKSQE